MAQNFPTGSASFLQTLAIPTAQPTPNPTLPQNFGLSKKQYDDMYVGGSAPPTIFGGDIAHDENDDEADEGNGKGIDEQGGKGSQEGNESGSQYEDADDNADEEGDDNTTRA